MRILGIDPGYVQSAWLIYDTDTQLPFDFGITENEELRIQLKGERRARILVVEMVSSFGMPVGREVFETVFWIGRFCESFPGPFERVYRADVKLHLCGQARAKDPHVRQALIDLYGPSKELAIGKKKKKGPLYGVSKDVWSALAVAVTWSDTHATQD